MLLAAAVAWRMLIPLFSSQLYPVFTQAAVTSAALNVPPDVICLLLLLAGC
jgi:hypothetical protein